MYRYYVNTSDRVHMKSHREGALSQGSRLATQLQWIEWQIQRSKMFTCTDRHGSMTDPCKAMQEQQKTN